MLKVRRRLERANNEDNFPHSPHNFDNKFIAIRSPSHLPTMSGDPVATALAVSVRRRAITSCVQVVALFAARARFSAAGRAP